MAPPTNVGAALQRLRPLISSLCEIAGTPGVAVGVIHHGKVIHEEYYGHRDVEAQLPVNRDTIFFIASLTKAMTVAALAILIHQGHLRWETPVHDILPEMSKDTVLYEAKLTVLDILSHRTGKAWADALWLGSNNRVLLEFDQAIATFDYLPQVAPPRTKYMYNNHAYSIAGLIIEKVSGQKWEDFLARNLFTPLGMSRTFTRHPSNDGNVAAPYNILTNKSASRLPFCNGSNDTMLFAGLAVRTSMGDLLKYCKGYLDALSTISPLVSQDTPKPISASCANTLIKEIATIIMPHIAQGVPGLLEQTYALGWNRTQLPGSLNFGLNQDVLDPFPKLGERYPGKLAIWHGGNMPGTTSALCLLPESESAVVVLQNSLGLCDVADWICQLTIDMLFIGKPAQDYPSLATRCVDARVKAMDEVERKLAEERTSGTVPRPLTCYIGRYYNSINNWFIDIKLIDGGLCLEFLGRLDERYALRHYHYDTFTWNLSYDEMVSRGQYVRPYQFYRLEFESGGGSISGIDRLRWRHDRSVPEGEHFIRATTNGLDVQGDSIQYSVVG